MKSPLKKVHIIINPISGTDHPIYVHCRFGEGRGPSMAIAYLMSTGMTYDDAYNQVKTVRTFIRPTKSQVESLMQFEASLANSSQ